MTDSDSPLYVRQLLVGHDIAKDDPFGTAMRNFIYVIGDRTSNRAVVVDPAYAPSELVAFVEGEGFELVGAVATHYHADHVGGELGGHEVDGLVSLLEITDLPVHIQRDEREWLTASLGLSPSAFVAHESGDVISLGSVELVLIHTPGHTPGSQCIAVNDALLTGDTLFLYGCGRTDLPGGDAEALYESLHRQLADVAPKTMVFPGHAYDPKSSAPMEDVRRSNPVLFDVAKQDWMAQFVGP